MSREVARHSPEIAFVPIGRLVLKGRTQELECVTAADHLPLEVLGDYLAAYEMLELDGPASRAALRGARATLRAARAGGLSLAAARAR